MGRDCHSQREKAPAIWQELIDHHSLTSPIWRSLNAGNFHFFLLLELTHVQIVIETLLCEQFIMYSAFDNLAIFEEQDHIRIADRGQTVGDNEGCAPFEELVECFLDKTFGSRVHAGGCLIQNKDARVCKRGARNGKQLALSLRET